MKREHLGMGRDLLQILQSVCMVLTDEVRTSIFRADLMCNVDQHSLSITIMSTLTFAHPSH